MFNFKEKTNELLNEQWAEEHGLLDQRQRAIQLIGQREKAGTVVRFIEFYEDEIQVGWGLLGDDIGVVELIDVATVEGHFVNGIPELAKYLKRESIQKWVRVEDKRFYEVGFQHAEVSYVAQAKMRPDFCEIEQFSFQAPEENLDYSDLDPENPFTIVMKLGAWIAQVVIGDAKYYMTVLPPTEQAPGRWIGGSVISDIANMPTLHYKQFVSLLLGTIPTGHSLIMLADNESQYIMPLFELGFVPEGYTFSYDAPK